MCVCVSPTPERNLFAPEKNAIEVTSHIYLSMVVLAAESLSIVLSINVAPNFISKVVQSRKKVGWRLQNYYILRATKPFKIASNYAIHQHMHAQMGRKKEKKLFRNFKYFFFVAELNKQHT